MNHKIATIRKFTAGRFTVEVNAVEEYDIDFSDWDADLRAEVISKIDNGELMVFAVKAVCKLDGATIATDYLGGCVYENPRAFMDHFGTRRQSRELSAKGGHSVSVCSYFADMVHNVCRDGREAVRKMQAVYVRKS